METANILDKLISENNGYLFTADAVANGVARQSVIDYVSSRNLEHVAHGVYITPDTWEDRFYILQLRNRSAVFSHETALQLLGLAEREFTANVTVKRGYNASHLREQNVIVHTVIKEYYDIGITQAKTVFGNTVNVYNPERTICDIIRNKDNMDIQVFSYAIKEYMHSRNKNLPLLSKYGKIFGVSDKIHTYTEVML
ncbi:MAG: abortive phage infection protein [Clostridia bacterium]|nr:abortive phage infection protein [Clostridia bacterium]